MYLITLKAGHPTGRFRRDGITVERLQPVIVDEASKKILAETWFDVKPVSEKEAGEAIIKGARDLRVAKVEAVTAKAVTTNATAKATANVSTKTAKKGK